MREAAREGVLATACHNASMEPKYHIHVDRERSLLSLTLTGFFGCEDVVAFELAKAAAMAQLGCSPNRHLTLCDISAMKIQPQDVVERFGMLLADPQFMSRRMAVVLGDSLARGQIRRLILERNARCFADRRSAERWLFEEPVLAVSRPRLQNARGAAAAP